MPRFSGMSLGDLMKVVLVRIVVYRSAFLSLLSNCQYMGLVLNRVAEVVRRHEGRSPKSLDLDESTDIRYCVAILRFVAIYALFGRLGGKKVLFWDNTSVFGQEVHFCMVYIAHYTELNFQLHAKTMHLSRKEQICA